MLQAISPTSDPHTTNTLSTSAASLAAALHDGKHHLLLAASGSVATIKLPEIARSLSRHPNLSIRIILTQSARRFLAGQSAEQPTVSALEAIPGVAAVYSDADEWAEPWRRGHSILHIDLRRWADLMVIAPLSANTLGKIANGLCDSLATSVVRAWDADGSIDGKRKRIIVAPAMNSAMYAHPLTARQLRLLTEDWGVKEGVDGESSGWFEVLPPMDDKLLACGDAGRGAMREWKEIVKVIEERLGLGN